MGLQANGLIVRCSRLIVYSVVVALGSQTCIFFEGVPALAGTRKSHHSARRHAGRYSDAVYVKKHADGSVEVSSPVEVERWVGSPANVVSGRSVNAPAPQTEEYSPPPVTSAPATQALPDVLPPSEKQTVKRMSDGSIEISDYDEPGTAVPVTAPAARQRVAKPLAGKSGVALSGRKSPDGSLEVLQRAMPVRPAAKSKASQH